MGSYFSLLKKSIPSSLCTETLKLKSIAKEIFFEETKSKSKPILSTKPQSKHTLSAIPKSKIEIVWGVFG